MKTILVAVAMMISGSLYADMAEVGKPFPPYTLKDQFGNPHTLSAATRVVVVASEKDVSGKVNSWLKTKDSDYLVNHRAEYVSDIEPMPGIITTLFALPKMKKYPFTLLLATEKEFAQTYPREKNKIAVFMLNEQQILTGINYVDSAEEVEALLTKPAPSADES